MFKSIAYRLVRYFNSASCPVFLIRSSFRRFNMSCAIVYSCATCSKTVKGKQDYAICVKCSKRVHRKCYDDYLSDSSWTRICQSFNCTACGAGSRGQNFNSNYFTDSERQLVIEESMEKTCMCQHTLHQQLLNTKL